MKFIAINNISKLLKIIDDGDNKLVRFLRVNYVVYNYLSNWILFAKSFFNRSLNPYYIASFFFPRSNTIETRSSRVRIYYNIIRNYDDIKAIVHTFDGIGTSDPRNLGNKYRYKLWVSFDVYMERIQDITLDGSSNEPVYQIIRVFNDHQYIISARIITSTDDVRELIEKLDPQILAANFLSNRPNTKFKIIGSSTMYVKILQMDGRRIGCINLSLTETLINSKSLITFNNTNNNFCFWNCIAYHYTKRRDRYTTKAIELYSEFMKYKFGFSSITQKRYKNMVDLI